MKTEKYLDENGISTTNKSKAKFLKIISFENETGDAIRSWTIKIDKDNIQKAKVYLKNPQDAPQNVKVERGKRGGYYYESSVVTERQQTEPSQNVVIKLMSFDSPELSNLRLIIRNQLQLELTDTILQEDYITNIIKKNNIKLENPLRILPFNLKDCFGFTIPKKDEIYLPSTPDKFINDWLDTNLIILRGIGYTNEELKGIDVNTKRAGTIIHEMGHLKILKLINVKIIETVGEMRDREFKLFHEYVDYINNHYSMNDQDVYRELDEMIAEDYRQIVGGLQANMPNRYFYQSDHLSSKNYFLKKGRLDILKKIGLF